MTVTGRHSMTDSRPEGDPVAAVWSASAPAVATAFGFSVAVNLLMLTAPLYMLQVYDRVLVSGSVETLVALSGLAAFLFLIMGILDQARGRIMTRVGARLRVALDGRVLSAALCRLSVEPRATVAVSARQDLDAVARFWASPVLLALYDAPWTPLFIGLLFVFHPWLGSLAVAGGLGLALVAWANQRMTRSALETATLAGLSADHRAASYQTEAEVIQALGMQTAALSRWQEGRNQALAAGLGVADTSGNWTVAGRTFRLFLQSAMLGLAAYLVLRDELSAGAMVAASVLLGRALAPIEQAVGQWQTITQARQARARLALLLKAAPPPRITLPRPAARLVVDGLTVLAAVPAPGVSPGSGTPILRRISFTLTPGEVMGVIGPSGAGKTTLARALVGLTQAAAGSIRLDGAALDQYDPEDLGRYIGYLPQRVALFDGTVAENIARLQLAPAPEEVIAAARAAAAHEAILALPQGYDTPVLSGANRLPGGLIQRIGLARALYRNPVLLVLDEPNASLDSVGGTALNAALRSARAAGTAVIVLAHRPAALQECTTLMVLQDGVVAALGPRDMVLQGTVRNAREVSRSVGAAG
ncbi:MAG: type I secretion system permease/ATPase [Rhodobacterales bacterium 32-66-7]|nr:MAG: type I secretion system permease/ATPase [Rhodobacterales bacterium 32-66-7]